MVDSLDAWLAAMFTLPVEDLVLPEDKPKKPPREWRAVDIPVRTPGREEAFEEEILELLGQGVRASPDFCLRLNITRNCFRAKIRKLLAKGLVVEVPPLPTGQLGRPARAFALKTEGFADPRRNDHVVVEKVRRGFR